jgi:hypothetical protein
MYLSTLFALEKLTMSTTKAHLQMKTRQQHSDERPIKLEDKLKLKLKCLGAGLLSGIIA